MSVNICQGWDLPDCSAWQLCPAFLCDGHRGGGWRPVHRPAEDSLIQQAGRRRPYVRPDRFGDGFHAQYVVGGCSPGAGRRCIHWPHLTWEQLAAAEKRPPRCAAGSCRSGAWPSSARRPSGGRSWAGSESLSGRVGAWQPADWQPWPPQSWDGWPLASPRSARGARVQAGADRNTAYLHRSTLNTADTSSNLSVSPYLNRPDPLQLLSSGQSLFARQLSI
jgi:hypothetical protein